MEIKALHPNFQLPVRSTALSGGYDLFMPQHGEVSPGSTHKLVGLGFSAAVPEGYVALILPRSGAGAKFGACLRNAVGVVDSDYRGEWMAAVSQREGNVLSWAAGDRLFQFLLVPAHSPELQLVSELSETVRGAGGFGSTGA